MVLGCAPCISGRLFGSLVGWWRKPFGWPSPAIQETHHDNVGAESEIADYPVPLSHDVYRLGSSISVADSERGFVSPAYSSSHTDAKGCLVSPCQHRGHAMLDFGKQVLLVRYPHSILAGWCAVTVEMLQVAS